MSVTMVATRRAASTRMTTQLGSNSRTDMLNFA
jgi:hypothetical protein